MSGAAGYAAPVLLVLALLGCAGDGGSATWNTGDGGAADGGGVDGGAVDGGAADGGGDDGGAPGFSPCPVGASHSVTGHLQDPAITEASGLVASPTVPGMLWLHNDSGDDAVLYAVSQAGQTAARITLDGVTAGDWEDLAVGPGPDPGTPWLFVGDIGDNSRTDPGVTVWMLPEPPLQDAVVTAQALELAWPDGPHDVEAMLVDPTTATLVLVTKETDGVAGVYAADLTSGAPALEAVASVDLNDVVEGGLPLVTAADITPDGACVLLRTYTHLLGFHRPVGAALHEAFAQPPVLLETAIELQGETVATFPGGYWTVSEGEGVALNQFQLPPP